MTGAPYNMIQATTDAGEVTATALIDKARADFRELGEAFGLPATVLDAFVTAGAAGALSEAYVRLSGEQLAGESDDATERTIRERQALLAEGIRIFRREAQQARREPR